MASLDKEKIKIVRDNSDHKDFQRLVQFLDDELNSRYGILQSQYDGYNKLEVHNPVVIGYENNNPVGCGSFKIFDNDSVEIKRMIVLSDSRGSGIAAMILQELENWAKEKGFTRSVLETGVKQPEAIKFYTKLGYSIIDNYNPYKNNPNSICMLKELK